MASSIKNITIAVDGFSSAGKSTLARRIAARLGYVFIDTGAMYRAVTLHAIRNGAVKGTEPDQERIVGLLGDLDIRFALDGKGACEVLLNGCPVEREIRHPRVSDMVSAVSSIPEVREKMVALQREMGSQGGVVMDGRDIGTVVFPDAQLKLFVTADPKVRAARRYDELRRAAVDVTLEQVEKNIHDRDMADQNREVSPLRKAPDAIELDTSDMDLEQELEWVGEKLSRFGIGYIN